MVTRRKYNVLYFVGGPAANADEALDAEQYGPNVKIRNAEHHVDGDGCEPCDAVAGPKVPRDYRRQYPKAVSYVEYLQGNLAAVAAEEPEAPVARVIGGFSRPADGALPGLASAVGEAPPPPLPVEGQAPPPPPPPVDWQRQA